MSRKIILVRHGEPDVNIAGKISGDEIRGFLNLYNNAKLKMTSLPSDRLKFLAQNATILCSDLPRSLASAQACEVQPDIVDGIFQESIPPYFRFSQLKLSPPQWLVFSRVLWMMGISRNGEALYQTRQRAKKAADLLIGADQEKDAVLFGHGLFKGTSKNPDCSKHHKLCLRQGIYLQD